MSPPFESVVELAALLKEANAHFEEVVAKALKDAQQYPKDWRDKTLAEAIGMTWMELFICSAVQDHIRDSIGSLSNTMEHLGKKLAELRVVYLRETMS